MAFRDDTVTFTNPTEYIISLDSLGIDPVFPGKDVEIPIPLCAASRTDNGNRGKSPIEQVAPQLHPKDPAEHKLWLGVPAAPTPVSKIVSIAPRAPSESPGVKALREQKEALAAKAKATAAAAPQTSTQKPQASAVANVPAQAGKA